MAALLNSYTASNADFALTSPAVRTVAIIDNHPMFSSALKDLILHIVPAQIHCFTAVQEAISNLRANPPECVVLEVCLPNMSAVFAYQQVRLAFPQARIMILSGNEELAQALPEVRAGHVKFMSKSMKRNAICDGMHELITNASPKRMTIEPIRSRLESVEKPAAPDGLKALENPLLALTPTQLSTLREIALGKSNLEIANRFGKKLDTVKSHVREIFCRLEARNRTHAAMIYNAFEKGDAESTTRSSALSNQDPSWRSRL